MEYFQCPIPSGFAQHRLTGTCEQRIFANFLLEYRVLLVTTLSWSGGQACLADMVIKAGCLLSRWEEVEGANSKKADGLPTSWPLADRSPIRYRLTSIGNPIVEIRRPYDHLTCISTMGFPILVRQDLYIESGPRFHEFCFMGVKCFMWPSQLSQNSGCWWPGSYFNHHDDITSAVCWELVTTL